MSLERTARWARAGARPLSRTSRPARPTCRARHPARRSSASSRAASTTDLRAQSADATLAIGFEGYAIGGLSVGEPVDVDVRRRRSTTADQLPRGPAALPDGHGHARRPRRIGRARHRHVRLRAADPQRPQRPAADAPTACSTSATPASPTTSGRPIDERAAATPAAVIRAPICGIWRRRARCSARRSNTIHNLFFYLDTMRAIREAIKFGSFEDVQTGIPSDVLPRLPDSMTWFDAPPAADVTLWLDAPTRVLAMARTAGRRRPRLGAARAVRHDPRHLLLRHPDADAASGRRRCRVPGRLKVGDKVITTGGIYGTVTKVNDASVQLQIAEKVRIEVAKAAVGGYQGQEPVVPGVERPVDRVPAPGSACSHHEQEPSLESPHDSRRPRAGGLGVLSAVRRPGRAGKVRLGLDLKGGVHLVLRVQTDDALKLETEMTAERLREALRAGGIAGADHHRRSRRRGSSSTGVPPAQDAAVPAARRSAGRRRCSTGRGGAGGYTFEMKPNMAVQLRERGGRAGAADDRAPRQRARRRPSRSSRRTARRAIRSWCSCRASQDPDQVKRVIGIDGAARAEDRRSRGRPRSQEALLQTHERRRAARHGGGHRRRPAEPGRDVLLPGASASRRSPAATCATPGPTLDENNLPAIGFSMNRDGAIKFGKLTGDNIGKPLAVDPRQPRRDGRHHPGADHRRRAASTATSRTQEVARHGADAALGRAAGAA